MAKFKVARMGNQVGVSLYADVVHGQDCVHQAMKKGFSILESFKDGNPWRTTGDTKFDPEVKPGYWIKENKELDMCTLHTLLVVELEKEEEVLPGDVKIG